MITLEIVTPEEEIFSGEIYSLRVPAHEGNLGILPGHAPMLCSLKPGTIRIRESEEDQEPLLLSTTGGFLEVGPERTVILADAAEKPDTLDIERARKAYIRAFKRLYSPEKTEEEVNRKRAEKALERARARLETAQEAGKDAEIPDLVQS